MSLFSALSDARNWAAIVAAAILVAGGIFAWFNRVSHALHVVVEKVAIGVDEGAAPGIFEVAPGFDLLNSSSVPLSIEIARFQIAVGAHEERDAANGDSKSYLAPQQKLEWTTDEPEPLHRSEFPVDVVARYEVQYGRKNRAWWWWRRALRGSFKVHLTFPDSGEPMTLTSERVEGPATDTRVPFTKRSIFGWRAFSQHVNSPSFARTDTRVVSVWHRAR